MVVFVPVTQGRLSATSRGADVAASSNDGIDTARANSGPLFRLGDAARPFSWSTAVGDFNTDGEPDVAVADHIGRRTSQYAYRLEFAISGAARRDVRFESIHEAVTIRAADVDSDHDLDIIVATPFSGETVGIWLNDGQGNFTAGDVRQVPAAVVPLQSLDLADSLFHFAAVDVSPRRVDSSRCVVLRAPPVETTYRLVASQTRSGRSVDRSSRTSPRAPPAVPLDALS